MDDGMAGYSNRSLPDKLGIKPGHRVQFVRPPAGIDQVVVPLPDGATTVSARARSADCILLFGTSVSGLERDLRGISGRMPTDGMLWIAWPKQAAKLETDLSESVVRRLGLATGLVDVKVCAITETWSGLKFVRRLRDR